MSDDGTAPMRARKLKWWHWALWGLLALILLSLVAGDGGDPGPARIEGPLGPEAQAARSRACEARLVHYRDLGVVRHGGARPGVDREAWVALGNAERREIAEIAACIASGGQVAERIVSITEEGGLRVIATERIANDRDFAGEFAGS